MQQPLQHENPQISNTNAPTIHTTQNTLTPQIITTRGPHSPIVVGLAAWVQPAGAGIGAATSEIIATPVTRTKISTTNPQISGTVDTFAHSSAAILPASQSNLTYNNSSNTSAVPVVTISALLTPDPRTEELLGALTIEQLSMIERTVQRVKRKKVKESKKQNPLDEISNATTDIDSLVVNINMHNSTTQNTPISNSTSISPVTFINKGNNNHYISSNFVTSSSSQDPSRSTIQYQQPSPLPTSDKSHQSTDSMSPDTSISNPTPNHALPATDPIIEECDGIPWVVFTYSVKGNNKEYRIRIDIDKANLDDIGEQFRRENCLYPRANCTEDKYQGNRWSYENECNSLGWKLAWLNKEEIGGRRGLLQRAVDSYRNRDPVLRSRRVVRNEKIMNGTLRKRVTRDGDGHDGINDNSAKKQKGAAKHLTLEIFEKGTSTRIRIHVDVDAINLMDIPEEFKKNNCIFPKANVPKNEYQGSKYEFETNMNELGWKLAYLNQAKLDGRKSLLHKALELYRAKYTTAEVRPRRGRYSHTLSNKFFENHPCEVTTGSINSINPPTSSVNNNEFTTEANLNDTISNASKEMTEGTTIMDDVIMNDVTQTN
ncbi:7262_t:CDS:2 [Funneliformis geosporum]|uniref:7262_t:CDS:1 n=1 Tax=Funneliformis geosporum TaxID=1117311 RepID=A0A9W4SD56_9GLOM|nr:7262_t:CDS:2 [Funneliformis geosporum]